MFIDQTYFKGSITIPNPANVINKINSYVSECEEEVLRLLLGNALYNEFITGIAEPAPLQKWIDLRDGADFSFTFDGRTVSRKWKGLVNSDKISLLAYYTYYKMRKDGVSNYTGLNESRGISENSETINETRPIINAHRNFLSLYGDTRYSYNGEDLGQYQGGLLFDKYVSTYDYYNDLASAYNFLNSRREADFQNWEFTPINRLNRFGI